MFMSVDLPEPDGPMIATKSPRSISNEMPLSTCTGTSPSRKSLTRFLISMMAAMSPPQNPGPLPPAPAGAGAAAGRRRRFANAARITRSPSFNVPLVTSVNVPSVSPVVTTTRRGCVVPVQHPDRFLWRGALACTPPLAAAVSEAG